MNNTAISNEEIIAALLQHGTIKDAAAALGISVRTVYDRMQHDKDFRAGYVATKTDIVRGATLAINKKINQAVEAITQIMTDQAVAPAIRLKAAQAILYNAVKFTERLAQDEHKTREEGKGPFDDVMEFFE